MGRINKSKRGKPSVRSRQRRREFLKRENIEAQRQLQVKLEEEDNVIKELQERLELSERQKEGKKDKSADLRKLRDKLNKEWEEKMKAQEEEWKACVAKQDEEWRKCWNLRMEDLQENHRMEVERAKQGLLQERVQLVEDKRSAERARDVALARVADLEREVGNLNRRLANVRSRR